MRSTIDRQRLPYCNQAPRHLLRLHRSDLPHANSSRPLVHMGLSQWDLGLMLASRDDNFQKDILGHQGLAAQETLAALREVSVLQL
jgi:hypothetical protein